MKEKEEKKREHIRNVNPSRQNIRCNQNPCISYVVKRLTLNKEK